MENWQSQIEVLLDRDLSRSIEQRVALREKVYRNLGVKDFKILANSTNPKKPATELNGYVIYAPTEQNPSWQVDIAKGKMFRIVALCNINIPKKWNKVRNFSV